MWNPTYAAELVELIAAGHAQARLERSGPVVDAGVDDLAVAAARSLSETAAGFENQRLVTTGGELACNREPEDAGTDHHHGDIVHGVQCSVQPGRARRVWDDGTYHTAPVTA